MEAYLGGPHPDDEEETKWMTEYLAFLKATADKPVHACRLVSKVEQTETKLETMYGPDIHRMRGIGLSVRLNDRNVHLLLDTGAGGIMVNHRLAEKAGLTPHRSAALRRHRRQRLAKRLYGGCGPHPNRRARVPRLCGLGKRQRFGSR